MILEIILTAFLVSVGSFLGNYLTRGDKEQAFVRSYFQVVAITAMTIVLIIRNLFF